MSDTGPGLWDSDQRVAMPNGEDLTLHEEPVHVFRWEFVTTARLDDSMPKELQRIG